MDPMLPPTQTCTAPWTASRLDVKLANVASAITLGTLDAIMARSAEVPGNRTTVIGGCGGGMGIVGVTDASQPGMDCSAAAVQSQYGMLTSGWIDRRACSMISK